MSLSRNTEAGGLFRDLIGIIKRVNEAERIHQELEDHEARAEESTTRAKTLLAEAEKRAADAAKALADAEKASADAQEAKRAHLKEAETLRQRRVEIDAAHDRKLAEFKARDEALAVSERKAVAEANSLASMRAQVESTLNDAKTERAKWQSKATEAETAIAQSEAKMVEALALKTSLDRRAAALENEIDDFKREFQAKKDELRAREAAVAARE